MFLKLLFRADDQPFVHSHTAGEAESAQLHCRNLDGRFAAKWKPLPDSKRWKDDFTGAVGLRLALKYQTELLAGFDLDL